MHIIAQGIWRSCQRLAHPIPGRGPVFLNMAGFLYNVRIFFCGGLRRQQILYSTHNLFSSVFEVSRR